METGKRLIDANALKAEFPVIGKFQEDLWHSATIRGAIDNAPTIDAVEVVHGRWVRCKDWDWDYECSACEGYAAENRDGNYDILTHYCPNCGAKMDAE